MIKWRGKNGFLHILNKDSSVLKKYFKDLYKCVEIVANYTLIVNDNIRMVKIRIKDRKNWKPQEYWRNKLYERNRAENEKTMKYMAIWYEELQQTDGYKRYIEEQNRIMEEKERKQKEKDDAYKESRKNNWWAQRFVSLQFPEEREYFAKLKKERERLKNKSFVGEEDNIEKKDNKNE